MRRRGGEDPEQIVPHVPRRLLAPVVGRPDLLDRALDRDGGGGGGRRGAPMIERVEREDVASVRARPAPYIWRRAMPLVQPPTVGCIGPSRGCPNGGRHCATANRLWRQVR